LSDRNYRQLGGVVDNILDTVKMARARLLENRDGWSFPALTILKLS